MSDNQERLTVRLTKEAIDEVKARAAAKGMTVNEFVRRALGTELYLLDQIDAGASVV